METGGKKNRNLKFYKSFTKIKQSQKLNRNGERNLRSLQRGASNIQALT